MTAVYIVDEEYHFAENVASALRFENMDAMVFHDATEALNYFVANHGSLDVSNVRLLVDVSLAAGDDLSTFSSAVTEEFYRTGIVLVQQLMLRCPGLCRKDNTVLYTAHFATELWGTIEEFCRAHGFTSWQKAPDSSVEDVTKLVM